MERTEQKRASFATQTNALMRKNLVFQKRNCKTNVCIVLFPVLLIILLAYLQASILRLSKLIVIDCPCDAKGRAINSSFDGICKSGIPLLNPDLGCVVPSPQKWPPLLKVPKDEFRAVKVGFMDFEDLPTGLCRKGQTENCPVSFLVTGGNRSFTESLTGNMFTSIDSLSSLNGKLPAISDLALGTPKILKFNLKNQNYIDKAFIGSSEPKPYSKEKPKGPDPIYILQNKCLPNETLMIPIPLGKQIMPIEVKCVEALMLWRDNMATIDKEIYQGYWHGNKKNKTNEIPYAFDFMNSSKRNYNVRIRYNATERTIGVNGGPVPLRVSRAINLASNAYLNFLKGVSVKMPFDFVKEMPQLPIPPNVDIDLATMIGELFYAYLMQLLFPVIVSYLVHEKQGKTRIMMKMHGLGDGPYWLISYAYFLILSMIYIFFTSIFGSIVNLSFFSLTSNKVQFVFFFAYMNLQIAFAILASTFFSHARTATVTAYIYILAIGIIGLNYFHSLTYSPTINGIKTILVELIPGLSLYRGVFEISQYAQSGHTAGSYGMQWFDLKDTKNGMKTVFIIMAIEWFVFLFVAIYSDRNTSSPEGTGNWNPLLKFLFRRKRSVKLGKSFSRLEKGKACVDMEPADVIRERELVEEILKKPDAQYSVVCHNLIKVHKGQDGNPDKMAVRGLSLALPRGECFGMLGPNGAGKTTLLNMLTGFSKPTAGTAYISGLDIRVDMNKIYAGIGVCPQHDLLWETLTAREHLLFYGRLKNLTGSKLTQAVHESLKSVNLTAVADKQAGQYSGGMKRRLSVAISLIGDSKVVYLDEPSTGLDPASRKLLWQAVMHAKQNRAIILTTHSMEEAEFLCDRLGIFVDGSLQCVGNPKELKAKYGGLYVLTITSSSHQDEEVENQVKNLSPTVKKIYHISGTQKFEMQKTGIRISDIFQLMENMKKSVNIIAWGVADTTLEDVFIKVAREAEVFSASNDVK